MSDRQQPKHRNFEQEETEATEVVTPLCSLGCLLFKKCAGCVSLSPLAVQIRIRRLSSVFSMTCSKDSKSASFRNGRILPTPRFRTWNTIPPERLGQYAACQ